MRRGRLMIAPFGAVAISVMLALSAAALYPYWIGEQTHGKRRFVRALT